MMQLRTHDITLVGPQVTLRPMTEDDWGLLHRWNNDPEVLYFAEGDDVAERSLIDMQAIYCQVSQTGYCFISMIGGAPIGECWLQEMNLARILDQYVEQSCWRIDLMIGEKAHWGKGLGTEIIGLLTRFGFEQKNADLIFGCDIADYNPRSRRAFEKAGYQLVGTRREPPGHKAQVTFDLMISCEQYLTR
jgi:RimJ/RimL family protein N-acetyltransferase